MRTPGFENGTNGGPHRAWRSFFASCNDLVTDILFIPDASFLAWNPCIDLRHDDLLFHSMRACWESKRILGRAPHVHPPLRWRNRISKEIYSKFDLFYIIRWTLEDGSRRVLHWQQEIWKAPWNDAGIRGIAQPRLWGSEAQAKITPTNQLLSHNSQVRRRVAKCLTFYQWIPRDGKRKGILPSI